MFSFACCCESQSDETQTSVFKPYGADDDVDGGSVVAAGAALSPKVRDPQTWEVRLKKAKEGPLGVELDIDSEKRLAVLKEPQRGPALAWNQSEMNKGFRPGDIVEAVNGVTDEAKALLTRIKESDPLTFSMKRLVDYTITVNINGGLGLVAVDSGGIAKVDSIANGGDVGLYNRTCLAGYRVAQGDWVVSVNGRSGAPRDLILMLDELGTGPVTLRFGRPGPSDNPGS